jgi:hypothetical protein
MELGGPRLIFVDTPFLTTPQKNCAFYKDGIKGGFDVYMNDINNISKCIYTCWHQHQTPNGCIF